MSPETTDIPPVRVLLHPADLRRDLDADARDGLTRRPKQLPPKYFYDDRGSELFDQITRLPEYYPTRAERAVLANHAEEMARLAGAEVLLELGSGSSEKTALLLDAMAASGALSAYVPVDVSLGALRGALGDLARSRPELVVHPVLADFNRHLSDLPVPGRRLVAFLGGTIGNFEPADRAQFLDRLATTLQRGECLLLGLDLVKDPGRLVAAYDDTAGITAEFNRNVLRILNRELGADFDLSAFTHVAQWNADEEWIEMRLRAQCAMKVRLAGLDLEVSFTAGEEMRTEISAKFRPDRMSTELRDAGFRVERWWTDPAADYAMVLARVS